MDGCEYRVVDVDGEWLACRMGHSSGRDLAREFDSDGWTLVATIARDGGAWVRVVFERPAAG
ncbi:MAG: hypothetical protein JWL73_3999 [Actinomycetia bacterium]|nr:hypothetical protein [Actinomycetes bacterium]